MSIETDWSLSNFFYFSNKLCICYVNFFIKLGSSFHLAQYGTRGSSVAQHLAQAFKVPSSVAWQKKLCKMLIFSKLCLVSSTICKENTEFHKEIIAKLLQDLLYKSPFHFQGTNRRRTHNVIFLSRDDFSDSIIFLCCKNTHSSLLFIILFTAIRHFPIYFTLLCNFSWQLISLFDSWPVMSSLFFWDVCLVFFFPPPGDVSTYYHRCIRPISHFFRRYPVIEQYCSLSAHLWFFFLPISLNSLKIAGASLHSPPLHPAHLSDSSMRKINGT